MIVKKKSSNIKKIKKNNKQVRKVLYGNKHDRDYDDPENKRSLYGKSVYFNKLLILIPAILLTIVDLFVTPFSDGSAGMWSLYMWGNTIFIWITYNWFMFPGIELRPMMMVAFQGLFDVIIVGAHFLPIISKPNLPIIGILTVLYTVYYIIVSIVDSRVGVLNEYTEEEYISK